MSSICSSFINVICDSDERYRIHSIWNDNNLKIILIDDFKAYKSIVSESALKELANKYKSIFGVFLDEIRNSLCTKDSNNIIFKRDGKKFIISRKQGNISVQFADFTLEEIDFNHAVIDIVDEINKSSQFYQNEASVYKREMEKTVEDKNKYIQKLGEFVEKKKDMEHELYSKFILILNEKKKRIQYLQESLGKIKNGKGRSRNEIVAEDNINGKKRETISDTDTESSIDEPVKTIVHNVQIECSEGKPKKKLNFLDDDDDGIKIGSLPKRTKVTETSPAKITKINDLNATNINVASKSPEIVFENNKDDSQDDLNFNTQDIIDRLC